MTEESTPAKVRLSDQLGPNVENREELMDMPTMPPLPRPALVLNLSLPMVKGGEIIPQPLWMESQLKDYAQQNAQQFERVAARLAIAHAELAHEVEKLRRTLGDIAEYAHKTPEVRRWCAEALGA